MVTTLSTIKEDQMIDIEEQQSMGFIMVDFPVTFYLKNYNV